MKQILIDIIKNFQDKRVIVWGDLILDEYIYTTSSRVSREAPVLITEFESNDFKLGGAGNVVMNIKTLGATPIPTGFIGANPDGTVLKDILKSNGISTDYLIELENYRTPKKSRILSGGENTKKQQVLRIDSISRIDIPQHYYSQLEHHLLELLENSDHLIISDYIFKSVIPESVNRIRQKYPHKILIIDSRYNLTDFPGISIATPNEPEIKRIFETKNFHDDQDFISAGSQLLDRLNAEGIILKRGHKGMIVFEKNKEPITIDIHGSADIVDVTGAGDTVISVIGLSLAAGANLTSAAQLATIAAGMVVMKVGAYPISKYELENELEIKFNPTYSSGLTSTKKD